MPLNNRGKPLTACTDYSGLGNFVDIILNTDESRLRAYLFAELLLRSKRDFSTQFRSFFGETWEFKILEVLTRRGSTNKRELSFELYKKDKHYNLSRSNDVKKALDCLTSNGVLRIERKGNGKYYSIDEGLIPLIRLIVHFQQDQ